MLTQLIPTVKNTRGPNGRIPRCSAAINRSDVVRPRKKKAVANDEEGESATWGIWRQFFGEQPRYRDFAIPLVMIVFATGVLLSVIPGASLIGVPHLLTGAAAIGFLVMWGQNYLLGTDFGPLGAAMIKVVAVTLFHGSLVYVLVEVPVVPVISLLCLPMIPIIFYVLTQWLFDMEYFEAFLFCVALIIVANLLRLI